MTARRWLALAVVWFAGAGLGWWWYFAEQARADEATAARQAAWLAAAQQVATVPATPAPAAPTLERASAERLMADVKALAFERKADAARAKARAHVAHALQGLGYRPELQGFKQGVNLVVIKPGTDPTAGALIVGAHYDTVGGSRGADDNATGVAAVMEVARLLAKTPLQRTVRFVFFDREEDGLLGSRAYTRSAARMQGVQAAIVVEMVGYRCRTAGCQRHPETLPIPAPTTGDFIAAIGDSVPLLTTVRQAARPDLPVFALLVPDAGRSLPDTRRSDHAPFWDRGVPAVMLTDTAELRNPGYHLPGDTPESLDPAFLQASAQLVLDVVVRLASP